MKNKKCERIYLAKRERRHMRDGPQHLMFVICQLT